MSKTTKAVETVDEMPVVLAVNEWLPKLQAAMTVQELKSALSQMTGEQVQSAEVQAEIARITGG